MNSIATLSCTATNTKYAEPASLNFYLYESAEEMRSNFTSSVGNPNDLPCGKWTGWSHNDTHAGFYACVNGEGQLWFHWSYDEQGVLAEARFDETSEKDALKWWEAQEYLWLNE